MRFRCAYVPAGNGIVERSHRTIKRIAARTRCSVMEAVYWYNVTPKDDASASTAPANLIYSYTARIRGVDVTLPPEDAGPSRYKVGDNVWVKIPHGRCTTQFGKGTITGVYSPHSVLVDGTPRHIKDVRLVRGADATYCSSASSEDEAPMLYLPREDPAASESDHSVNSPFHKRSCNTEPAAHWKMPGQPPTHRKDGTTLEYIGNHIVPVYSPYKRY